MCGSISGRNPLSSCQGPRLEDDVESFIVMPGSQFTFTKERCFKHDQQHYFLVPSITFFLILTGCTLEVWDESDGVDKQVSAERKSANEGFIRNAKDLYNKEKLVLRAEGDANWIEELNDDFNDMNEDISSYRCRCG